MCLPIRLPAQEFFTIMKFHNNEIHNNEGTPNSIIYSLVDVINNAGKNSYGGSFVSK